MMDGKTLVEAGRTWHPITPIAGRLDQLAPGRVHPVLGHSDLAIAVLEDPRAYTVIRRWCAHRPEVDLTRTAQVDSRISELTCTHVRHRWCLVSGKAAGPSDALPVYPTRLVAGTLYARLGEVAS